MKGHGGDLLKESCRSVFLRTREGEGNNRKANDTFTGF